MVAKLQIEIKDHSLSAIFLFYSIFSIEIRWVFSHAKLMISWWQWLEKKVGYPCSLGSYSHFSTDRAQYQGKSAMFFNTRVIERALMTPKLCAVRMRNAKQRNDLKLTYYLSSIVAQLLKLSTLCKSPLHRPRSYVDRTWERSTTSSHAHNLQLSTSHCGSIVQKTNRSCT